jgi:hypothetical protein
MNDRDVLIARVHDGLGAPVSAAPTSTLGRGETLWAVTAQGQEPLTLLPFTDALDMALTWAGESGGSIYLRDQPSGEPRVYNAAW